MFDVAILQPLLEDTTHHLGSTISCDVVWNVPRSSEIFQDGHQVLAIKLARGGGHMMAFQPLNLSAITEKLWLWREK